MGDDGEGARPVVGERRVRHATILAWLGIERRLGLLNNM